MLISTEQESNSYVVTCQVDIAKGTAQISRPHSVSGISPELCFCFVQACVPSCANSGVFSYTAYGLKTQDPSSSIRAVASGGPMQGTLDQLSSAT